MVQSGRARLPPSLAWRLGGSLALPVWPTTLFARHGPFRVKCSLVARTAIRPSREAAMTLLYTDPVFLKHDTGTHHPETSERLRAVTARLEKSGLAKKCTAGKFKPLDEETVSKLHAAKMVTAAKQLAAHGGGHLESDTVVSPDSFNVALSAGGACTAAVDAVLKGPERNALCLIRPPGHHATPKRS